MKSRGNSWRRLRILENPILRVLLGSIKGQIFIVFTVTLISVSALMLLNLWNLSTLKYRLLLGDRYYDLLNNVLEVRRYEKNYLFYSDVASLREGRNYLKSIDSIVSDLSKDIIDITDLKTIKKFRDVLGDYERVLRLYEMGDGAAADPELIRSKGKELTDFADMFLRVNRKGSARPSWKSRSFRSLSWGFFCCSCCW